jgi:phage terminase small subunit
VESKRKAKKPRVPTVTNEKDRFQRPAGSPLTDKDRLYVYLRILGKAQATACMEAYGWTEDAALKRAYLIEKSPHIAAVLEAERAKLRNEAKEKFEITKERVLGELAKIAFADAKNFFKWGPDGISVRDQDDLNQNEDLTDSSAAVSEVSETTTKDGGSIRVKLHSKKDALDSICRVLGFNQDKVEVKVESLSDDERIARIASILAQGIARKNEAEG